MMRGTVIGRAAHLRLAIRGPLGETDVEGIVDTGFSGDVTLPLTLVRSLGLETRGVRRSLLADGSEVTLDTCAAEVLWHSGWIRVTVCVSPVEPLLGMGLLYGSELRMRAIGGGGVTISPLDALPA